MAKIFLGLMIVFVSFQVNAKQPNGSAQGQSVGLICQGLNLYSSQRGELIASYSTSETCLKAIKQSVNGFICHELHLYSANYSGYITFYGNSDECAEALKNSKNGVICKDANLYTSQAKLVSTYNDQIRPLAIYPNAQDCKDAIKNSR